MKTSRAWLQKHFDAELPSAEVIADALTFHVAEIEEVKGDLIDVNVLPDRAAYLLSHRGVAKEIGTALDIPLSNDPLAEALPEFRKTDRLTITLDDEGNCVRYMGAIVRGVTVGPSPAWLKEALESVGQRSINNVVDATNYVMLSIGQPLHAFDLKKLAARGEAYSIKVRGAEAGESFTSLTGDTYELPEGTLLITDDNANGTVLGIAGVKGGTHAEVNENTTELLVEAATFDGKAVRKTAQALKLFTDASSRFQNKPSSALPAYGMRDVLTLITDIAGGTLEGVTDVYPVTPEPVTAKVTLERVNTVLGTEYTAEDVREVFRRLGFSYTEVEGTFVVLSPFERTDLVIPEDLVEEVGRVLGYERLIPRELEVAGVTPDQERFRGIERVRDFLVDRGYVEVSTPSFETDGEIELLNPLQTDRPYLRASLIKNLKDALTRTAAIAPRVFGPEQFVRLFEIGTVFTKSGEHLVLSMGVVPTAGKPAHAAEALKQDVMALEQDLLEIPSLARYSLDGQVMELDLGKLNLEKLGATYVPLSVGMGAFHPYSSYPFALRDVAVWTPEGTEETEVLAVIVKEAGEYLARLDLFDRFEKEERISYAFRLVFESMERTLADTDLDPAMARITDALNAKEGWEVR